jgi:type IV secretory pathway TraG/TraD family ATPase VirD4
MNRDCTCLADGLVVPADFEKTGLNLNEIIVGATGCGKSMSNAYSRVVHTYDSSLVVPISKRALMDKFIPILKERGYKIQVLDFANPENSNIGYDPMFNAHTDEDLILLAKKITAPDEKRGSNDPYWDNSANSVLTALMMLSRANIRFGGKRSTFYDVIKIYQNMNVEYVGKGLVKTALDPLFDRLDEENPGNQENMLWNTFRGLPERTGSTVYSCLNTTMDKFLSKNVMEMAKKYEQIKFSELGKQKTALFILTSPMNTTLQNYINLMYSDLFRELFNEAERNENRRLDVPVHIICDDFACGSRILDFEKYISIFRAAGISVTLLLQSESQLSSMYGIDAAKTIINNCDTYVYMGGMDIETCNSISAKANKTLATIMSLPKENVIVFRRGHKPYFSKRYQITEDPEYIRAMYLYEEQIDKKGDRNE